MTNDPEQRDPDAPSASDLDAPRTSDLDAPHASDLDAPNASDLDAPSASGLDASSASDLDAPSASGLDASSASGLDAPSASDLDGPSASDLDAEAYRREVRAKKQRKGLVIVNTGHGKGKTTAAFGLAFRARGRGMPVAIIQFLKRDGANYGELRAAREMGIEIEGAGDGWTWTSKDLDHSAELARAGWTRAQQLIEADQHAVIVLDEFTYPMIYGWVDTAEVISWLHEHKPDMLHLVITGRDAPEPLVEYADLVTEMRLLKHPFEDQGIKAQPGVEF